MEVAINPTSALELPACRGRRQRIADPAEAAALIDALPADDRVEQTYRLDEFNPRTGRHKTEDCSIPNARSKTLIQEEVHDRDESAIGMTKADFAEKISTGEAPFDDVSFEGFRGTFEAIREALLDLNRARHEAHH